MNLQLLAGFPVVVEQAVAWGDMDACRHVNNVVYFRYFENARLEYFRRIGWFELEAEQGVGPIIHSTQARYRRPLIWPDQIAIAARVSTLETDRFVMEHRLVSRSQGAIAAEGSAVVVAYRYAQQAKTAIPDELRKRIDALEGR